MPVIFPALSIIATKGLLDIHVPPVEGDNEEVPFIQIESGPVNVGVGISETCMTSIPELHPVNVSVNTTVVVPRPTPVTTPELEIVTTALLLDTHVPPVVGETNVFPPKQIISDPVIVTVGLGMRKSELVVVEHPVGAVYTKVTVPGE